MTDKFLPGHNPIVSSNHHPPLEPLFVADFLITSLQEFLTLPRTQSARRQVKLILAACLKMFGKNEVRRVYKLARIGLYGE